MVWMLIIAAETVSGVLREVFLAPVVGSLAARQIGVPIGCVLIFTITWLTIRWLGVATRRWFAVGALWVALTVVFEISLGRATGASWSGIFADYDPTRGGLMLFGLLFLWLAPWLAARMRA